MKNYIRFLLCSFFFLAVNGSFAQTPNLHFDGVDDYMDLGPNAGNGVRTIELWFKLDNPISPSLTTHAPLISREIGLPANTNEFVLTFQPYNTASPGRLRFDIDQTAPYKEVLSDSSSWEADRWYHVAAVVHPVDGMMLFIDGIKQQSTHSHNLATPNVSNATTVGYWGMGVNRYFKGNIEDIRFSSEALYTSNFTPICPDLTVEPNTIGLWNMNEGTGTTANDSSTNSYTGTIYGATWSSDFICESNSQEELYVENISVATFPNPSTDQLQIRIDCSENINFEIKLFDLMGKEVLSNSSKSSNVNLDISNLASGTYVLRIYSSTKFLYSTKVVLE